MDRSTAVYDDLQRLAFASLPGRPPRPGKVGRAPAQLRVGRRPGRVQQRGKKLRGCSRLSRPRRVAKTADPGMDEPPHAFSPAPPGTASPQPAPIDHRRFQIQALMENLASTEGDLETLTAVKQSDLSSPHDFLSLAEWHGYRRPCRRSHRRGRNAACGRSRTWPTARFAGFSGGGLPSGRSPRRSGGARMGAIRPVSGPEQFRRLKTFVRQPGERRVDGLAGARARLDPRAATPQEKPFKLSR